MKSFPYFQGLLFSLLLFSTHPSIRATELPSTNSTTSSPSPSPASPWEKILAFEQQTPKLPHQPAEAKTALEAHYQAELLLLEQFLTASSGDDPHLFEAKVRQAIIQARLALLEENQVEVDHEISILIGLERVAPDEEQAADATFRRISLQWQNLGRDADQRREKVLATARNFAASFPRDHRAPRLLADAEALCDNYPLVKRELITEALALSPEESLKKRLEDDQHRLDLLGHPVDFSFTDTKGQEISLKQYRGEVVAVIFWASESAPSLLWLRDFISYANDVPSLKVIAISLDEDRGDFDATVKMLPASWINFFDGHGWQNQVARRCGINTLPTLWLIDRQGCLQALNACHQYQFKVRQLLQPQHPLQGTQGNPKEPLKGESPSP